MRKQVSSMHLLLSVAVVLTAIRDRAIGSHILCIILDKNAPEGLFYYFVALATALLSCGPVTDRAAYCAQGT